MSRGITEKPTEVAAHEWVSFPGGELEGKRPKALCAACREALDREAHTPSRSWSEARPSRPLCFQCYRAELDRQRAIGAAADLDTGSAARFQVQLPFEPVNRARLDGLKAARAEARADAQLGVGRYVDKRRQAQIAARRTLQCLADGLKARKLTPAAAAHAMDAAIHAAELQLPDAWLPFVVSR
jgi:hypothetical protein